MISQETTIIFNVGTAATVIGFIWKLASKIATTDTKVNTLWDYHIRRSVVAGINNDTLQLNSPIRPTAKGEEWFKDILPDMQEWYLNGKYGKVSDRELFIALESQFGRQITKDIAAPHNVHPGEAIAIAVALLRNYKLP